VLDERLRLELYEYVDGIELRVDKIREDKINDAIFSPEGDSRFGPVPGERLEACPFTASHHDAENFRLHAGLLSWYDALCFETCY
jgi:hypothetical protein